MILTTLPNTVTTVLFDYGMIYLLLALLLIGVAAAVCCYWKRKQLDRSKCDFDLESLSESDVEISVLSDQVYFEEGKISNESFLLWCAVQNSTASKFRCRVVTLLNRNKIPPLKFLSVVTIWKYYLQN